MIYVAFFEGAQIQEVRHLPHGTAGRGDGADVACQDDFDADRPDGECGSVYGRVQ